MKTSLSAIDILAKGLAVLSLFALLLNPTNAAAAASCSHNSVLNYGMTGGVSQGWIKISSYGCFRIELRPDEDIDHVVRNFEVDITKKHGFDENILDSSGNLHGYQPYDFTVSEFSPNGKVIYGKTRTVILGKYNAKIILDVLNANVSQVQMGREAKYGFSHLTVKITSVNLSKISAGREN